MNPSVNVKYSLILLFSTWAPPAWAQVPRVLDPIPYYQLREPTLEAGLGGRYVIPNYSNDRRIDAIFQVRTSGIRGPTAGLYTTYWMRTQLTGTIDSLPNRDQNAIYVEITPISLGRSHEHSRTRWNSPRVTTIQQIGFLPLYYFQDPTLGLDSGLGISLLRWSLRQFQRDDQGDSLATFIWGLGVRILGYTARNWNHLRGNIQGNFVELGRMDGEIGLGLGDANRFWVTLTAGAGASAGFGNASGESNGVMDTTTVQQVQVSWRNLVRAYLQHEYRFSGLTMEPRTVGIETITAGIGGSVP